MTHDPSLVSIVPRFLSREREWGRFKTEQDWVQATPSSQDNHSSSGFRKMRAMTACRASLALLVMAGCDAFFAPFSPAALATGRKSGHDALAARPTSAAPQGWLSGRIFGDARLPSMWTRQSWTSLSMSGEGGVEKAEAEAQLQRLSVPEVILTLLSVIVCLRYFACFCSSLSLWV